MIGRIIGEIFEVLSSGAVAGFFSAWVPKTLNALKGGAAHPLVKDYLEKRVIGAKGLKDSHLFTYFLSASKIPIAKRRQIETVFNFIETINPKYAENARVIIAMDEVGRGTVTVTKKDGTVTTVPDPKYKHPGISILQHLAQCNTDAEMIAAIMAMGAFDEAPNGTLDEIELWFKQVAWPKALGLLGSIPAKANAIGNKAGDAIFSFNKRIRCEYAERNLRIEARSKMTWKDRLKPVNLLSAFRDQF
jgi:hypothetical protein